MSLTIARKNGSKIGIAFSARNMGCVEYLKASYIEASTWLARSLEITLREGNAYGIASSRQVLAMIALREGKASEAKTLLKKCIEFYRMSGYKSRIAWCLEGFAGAAIDEGDAVSGMRLLGAADAIRESMQIPRRGLEKADIQWIHGKLPQAYTDRRYKTHVEEGRSMALGDAVDYALNHSLPCRFTSSSTL